MAAKSQNVGGENPEFILRDFQGMNCIAAREDIDDNEFYWCENAIPVAAGALYPVPSPLSITSVTAETGAPTYTMTFNAGGIDYGFSVWSHSGNGYVTNLSGLGSPPYQSTHIISGLTSGQTSATQYSNQGLLIVDPSGFWDWNVTTPATLTPQYYGAAIPTLLQSKTFSGATTLKLAIGGGAGGSGATFQTTYQVVGVQLTNGGTGYAVGDTLNLTDSNPTTTAQIIVATISGGGATGPITAITLASGGAYPGPDTTTTGVVTGPSGSVSTTTGSGTGATFTTHVQAVSLDVLTRGFGYTTAIEVSDVTSTNFAVDTWSVSTSGVIGGTSIATYAGRVWIGLSRTVYFTDINSYYSFGGVGGSFFIPDSYLHDNITALFAANNYLYIFGDTSVDALSNVTVTGGVTFFSRINVTASVGTSTPCSIFAYYRAIVFYHASGFYLLAGATPEKISDKISGILPEIVAATGTTTYPLVYGCQVIIQGELCAVMQFCFLDVFTQGGASRNLLALFFRGRWWVSSFVTTSSPPAMFSVDQSGEPTIYAWDGDALYRLFATGTSTWLLKTKLWDGGAPTHDKQSINAAVGGNWAGNAVTGITMSCDTEVGSSEATVSPIVVQSQGYHFAVGSVNEGGTQYLGMTVTGSTDMTQIRMLALRGKTDARDKLQ